MQRLRQNLFYKLLSLGCALGLFLYVRKAESTERSDLTVPITFQKDADVEILEPAEARFVNATLRGPLDLVRSIKAADITARVDLTGKRKSQGAILMPIDVELPAGVRDRVELTYTPRQIKIRLDEHVTRYLQVTPQVIAQLPTGYTHDPPEAHPDQVAVTGLSAVVARVKDARAIVTEIDGTGMVNVNARVSVVDEAGNDLRDRLQVLPPVVKVRVPLKRAVSQKAGVYVHPRFGPLAPGLTVASVAVRPVQVEVTGSDAALAALWVLETETIDLPSSPGPFERIVTIPVPEGVTRIDPARVRVTVKLDRGATTPARRPGPEPSGTPAATEKRSDE